MKQITLSTDKNVSELTYEELAEGLEILKKQDSDLRSEYSKTKDRKIKNEIVNNLNDIRSKYELFSQELEKRFTNIKLGNKPVEELSKKELQLELGYILNVDKKLRSQWKESKSSFERNSISNKLREITARYNAIMKRYQELLLEPDDKYEKIM